MKLFKVWQKVYFSILWKVTYWTIYKIKYWFDYYFIKYKKNNQNYLVQKHWDFIYITKKEVNISILKEFLVSIFVLFSLWLFLYLIYSS